MSPEEKRELRKKRFENTKDMICSNGNKGHDWIPVAWNLGEDTKHVATLMCGRCFCQISINDCYEFGKKAKDL